MMPRIDATEQLDAIRVGNITSGNMEKDARTDAVRALQARAKGAGQNGQRKARRATAQDLAGMGIGVRIAPPSKEGHGG